MSKPKVYIAHPITSSGHMIQNMRQAAIVWRTLIDCGFIPFCPGLVDYGANMACRPMTYEEWMSYDFEWLDTCDVVFRITGKSPGADREVRRARRDGKSSFTKLHNIVKWKDEVYYKGEASCRGQKSTSTKATQSFRSKKKVKSQPSSGRSTKRKGRR